MALCSLIVPVRNRVSQTRQALDALLKETSRAEACEIIVVDDGSTDITGQVLSSYGDQITVLAHETPRGFLAACAAGAQQARGDLLVFVDVATLARPGWLGRLLAYADEQPGMAVIGSKLLYPDDTVCHAGVAIAEDRTPRFLYRGLPAEHPAVCRSRRLQAVTLRAALVRREPFLRVGGFDLQYGESLGDVDLCLRLGQAGYVVQYWSESVHMLLDFAALTLEKSGRAQEAFRERWGRIVTPDEFRIYAEDQILGQIGQGQPADEPALVPATLGAAADGEATVLAPWARTATQFLAEYRRRFEGEPAVLDLDSGLNLPQVFVGCSVFSPPRRGHLPLPYLDASVDVVVVLEDHAEALAEAERVAQVAVLRVQAADPQGEPPMLDVSWLQAEAVRPLPSVSIIIPIFNQLHHTKTCLAALETSIPEGLDCEIIVVDDASSDESPAFLLGWSAQGPRRIVLRNAVNSGFIDTCNRGASAATGEILLFLNNDTIPLGDWLTPLLATFRETPNVGVVGSKLLYQDGRLQEAGGVIFADGSGWNLGRLDRSPDAPLYSYVRDVDYCSGAALATPRALFQEIGGFDTRYRPAYYEDTDYCFSVRQRGLRVLYQPESAVIHVEGGTSGTDLASGVKRHQVVNRVTFVEKWRAALDRQGSPPARNDFATRHRLVSRPGKRRALVCAPVMPEFDRESGSRRVFHFIEFLLDAGWDVSFMAPYVPEPERYARILQRRGVATYPRGEMPLTGERYATEAERLIATGAFDLAILAFWYEGERYLKRFRTLSPRTRVLVDSIDVHFLRHTRGAVQQHMNGAASGSGAGPLDAQFADQFVRELNVYAMADAVLTVSDKEAALIRDFTGDERRAYAVYDSEPIPERVLPFEERQGILFMGNFRHPPNREAAEVLCREIAPRLDPALVERHPISIVGNGLDDAVLRYGDGTPYVRMIGWVPSVVPYLASARVSVVPLLHGAGTKRKLLQALSLGTPTVSTTVGVEGLDLQHGEHVLVTDDPARMAEEITRLVDDAELWGRLSTQGQARVLSTHGREVVRRQFLQVIDSLLQKPRVRIV